MADDLRAAGEITELLMQWSYGQGRAAIGEGSVMLVVRESATGATSVEFPWGSTA